MLTLFFLSTIAGLAGYFIGRAIRRRRQEEKYAGEIKEVTIPFGRPPADDYVPMDAGGNYVSPTDCLIASMQGTCYGRTHQDGKGTEDADIR
jgi:hypothetical protein